MASLVWLSVFLLLILELCITLLLVLPFPRFVRRFIAKKVFSYDLARRFSFAAKFIFFGLLLAVSDAINTLMRLEGREERVEQANPAGSATQAGYITTSLDKQRKFRAERNSTIIAHLVYLAGFALTLGFVIYRLMDLLHQLVSVEEEKDSLRKRITDMGEVASKTSNIPSDDISTKSKPTSTIRKRATATDTESTTDTVGKKGQ